MRPRIVAVIGESVLSDPAHGDLAEAVGRGIAAAGHVLVCGGLGGVMEAASRGAMSRGGVVVGLLPSGSPDDANPYVMVPVATGLGEARSALVATAADAVIAIGGGHGTLSEIGHALRAGKVVIALHTWSASFAGTPAAVVEVHSAEEALAALARVLEAR